MPTQDEQIYPTTADESRGMEKKGIDRNENKVLLIIVDAMTPRVVEPEMSAGRLPNLAALAGEGYFSPACTTIFPSITHAALASLATGAYPARHGIPGGHWYDTNRGESIHLMGERPAVWRRGVLSFARDFLVRYNHEYLHAPTLFEKVDDAGLDAACLNFLIHRGRQRHAVDLPLPADLAPGLTDIEHISGPPILMLGTLLRRMPDPPDGFSWPNGGLGDRLGFDDDHTASALLSLAEYDRLPALTIAYFADNDYASHADGPENARDVLHKLDAMLGDLFQLYGGLTEFLAHHALIITGDHAQSDIETDDTLAAIDVERLLADFPLTPLGETRDGAGEIVVAPNLRALQLYLSAGTEPQAVIDALLADPAVDQVIWRADHFDADAFSENVSGYCVTTQSRGTLCFAPVDRPLEGRQCARDAWGGWWRWEGALAAVDAAVHTGDDGIDQLSFEDYPNAFERIVGVLDAPQAGNLWATARPGREFVFQGIDAHVDGGSHGSLHADDSAVPLFVAGRNSPALADGPPLRSVDIAPLCLEILGVAPSGHRGGSHTLPAASE